PHDCSPSVPGGGHRMNGGGLGLLTLVASGILVGSFAFPLKFSRAWSWENSWLLYATFALIVIPLTMALCLVPHLGSVYMSVPARGLVPPLLFGLFWGIAQLAFGIAIRRVGMAMAFAIVIGISAVVGSAIPLVFLHSAELASRPSLFLLISALVLTLGLWLYAQAGRQREEELQL